MDGGWATPAGRMQHHGGTTGDREQAMTAEATTVITPAKLSHVVLRTPRLAEVVDWYCTVLGARVVHENEVLSFLTYDDEHHRIAVIGDPGLVSPTQRGPGLEHMAFTYEHLDELLATYLRLRDAAIEPVFCVNHGMTVSMYYADPDGNQVELQIDRCSVEEAMAFMESETFAANPVGIPFDPEDLVARRAEGESVESVTAYEA
jgi:catechol-2,3-dioxygenase